MLPTCQDIQEQFELLPDWMDRYQLLVDWGHQLPIFPEIYRDEAHRVSGCQSNVWLVHHWDGSHLSWSADSDAWIVKGLLAVLLGCLNDQTPQMILTHAHLAVEGLGLQEHLSPSRSNGFHAVFQQMLNQAAIYHNPEDT